MRFKRTLLLIGVLVLLTTYYYTFEVKLAEKKRLEEEQRQEEERNAMKVFPFSPKSITEIAITKRNATIVYQKKDGEGWEMVEPLKAVGGVDALDNLLTSLTNFVLETDPVNDHAETLAPFGLDHPQMTITVKSTEIPRTVTILLGDRNPTNSTFYAALEGSDKVFLTGTLIEWEIDKEYENIGKRTGPFFESKKERAP